MNDQTEDLLDPATEGATSVATPPVRALPGLKAMAGPLLGVALVSLGIGFLLARNVGEEPANAGLAGRTVTTPPSKTSAATTAPGAGTTSATGGPSSAATSTSSASTGTSIGTTTGASTVGSGATTATSATGGAATTAASGTTAGPTAAPTTAATAVSTTLGAAGTTVTTTPAVGPTQAPTTQPATTTTRPATTTTRPQPTTTTTRPAPTTVPGPPYVAAVRASAPVGYWRLDEPSGGTAADQSGNGRTGVYAGGFLTNQGGALANGAGRAVLFESGAVEVPDTPALRLNGAFTIELWARLGSFQNTWPGLVVKGAASGPDGYLVYYDSSGRVILKRNNVEVASAPSALRTDAFTHLAVTYDGTTVRWYVDGTLSSSKSASYPTNNGGAVLAIGKGEQYGIHTLDEVAIYGSALSALTLQAHVDAGRR